MFLRLEMWLLYVCSSMVVITFYIIQSKKPFFKDLLGHEEGFGIDHNRPGTSDFLFYLGMRDFNLRNVSHILLSSVLTLIGQQMLLESLRGGQLSVRARGKADFPCKHLQNSSTNIYVHYFPWWNLNASRCCLILRCLLIKLARPERKPEGSPLHLSSDGHHSV